MVNLAVDESFAFDFLSILQIKYENLGEEHESALRKCYIGLFNQLKDRFDTIISSPEYQDVYEANQETFDVVESARYGGNVTAKEVDDCNMKRFYAKQRLQEKFFKTKLTEKKS